MKKYTSKTYETREILRSQQKTAREYIDKVRYASGPYAADCYIGGLILGIAEYMTDRYGRRAAYNYLAGFADDLMFAESSDERLGK